MRIERREGSLERDRQLGSTIAEAAACTGVDGRVCGDRCIRICSQCGSLGCQCDCSPDCPEVPLALSIDPEHLPIEPLITPLVFEMKRLGVFRPCWSCEGHLHPNGTFWKVPRVWFYCDSRVHVRILADALANLKGARKLSTRWQVLVTYSDPDHPETTFSLEPLPPADSRLSLPSMQKDVVEIARSLHAMMTGEARNLQRETEQVLAGNR